MQAHDFRRFLGRLEELSPAQIKEAGRRIDDVSRRVEAITEIEARIEDRPRCPHCHHEGRQKWGRTRTNLQRYRCTACRRTFTARTGSRIARLHRPGLFLEVARDMLGNSAPSSVRSLAERLDINKHTVWRWRMIILAILSGVSDTSFGGIVEADETFQRESRKGSREWVRHIRNPTTFPKPPRIRWYEYGRKGVPMLRGLSRWQRVVLTVADRGGHRRFDHISGRSNGTIQMALAPHLKRDAVLCTDGLKPYAALAQTLGLEHKTVPPKSVQKTASGTYHIQTVNSLHARYKNFIRLFRGPATKNLQGYLDWFVARLCGLSATSVLRNA